jgi:hypothetical protein
MTNDQQLDRIERMLREYLRTERPKSWKKDPRIQFLLERQRQYEEGKKKTPNPQSDSARQ